MKDPPLSVSQDLLDWCDHIRRDLHRHPELSMQETRTCARVAELLREMGLDSVREGVAGTGVLALLRGSAEGPTVALRADMDALPIQEETDLPWASERPGVAHACGHDGHMAVLLGAARLLNERREDLPGNVRFIFQPGEEGYGGAQRMVQHGCLEQPPVESIFAFHNVSALPAGHIELSLTPYAAMRGVRLLVRGSGGHGACPHTTCDPIAAAAQIVVTAQTIVSRELAPAEPGVLSFGTIHGGSAGNIIPDEVELHGTIRALSSKTAAHILQSLERIAHSVAEGMRMEARVATTCEYPPARCDPALIEFVERVGTDVLGTDAVHHATTLHMGAEDFAYYLPAQGGVPGVIFRMGTESEENLHTARYDFGRAALRPAVVLMSSLARRRLQALR
jgi:amidohydrolase